MLWIYGSDFAYGSARMGVYDGSKFAAEHGVIVVTANYGLNGEHFLAVPEFPEFPS